MAYFKENLAKQFVDIFQNESSLFLDTLKRVSGNTFSDPLIISNISQRFEILKLIKKFKLKTDKIILETVTKILLLLAVLHPILAMMKKSFV